MRDVLDKAVDKIKTHFMFHNFFRDNGVVYEIILRNRVKPDRPQVTIQYGA
jgi:hypothetical protein